MEEVEDEVEEEPVIQAKDRDFAKFDHGFVATISVFTFESPPPAFPFPCFFIWVFHSFLVSWFLQVQALPEALQDPSPVLRSGLRVSPLPQRVHGTTSLRLSLSRLHCVLLLSSSCLDGVSWSSPVYSSRLELAKQPERSSWAGAAWREAGWSRLLCSVPVFGMCALLALDFEVWCWRSFRVSGHLFCLQHGARGMSWRAPLRILRGSCRFVSEVFENLRVLC